MANVSEKGFVDLAFWFHATCAKLKTELKCILFLHRYVVDNNKCRILFWELRFSENKLSRCWTVHMNRGRILEWRIQKVSLREKCKYFLNPTEVLGLFTPLETSSVRLYIYKDLSSSFTLTSKHKGATYGAQSVKQRSKHLLCVTIQWSNVYLNTGAVAPLRDA